MAQNLFLPGLPVDLIEAVYRAAPGNEIDSGKFASPESSAALVANAFGAFLAAPETLPPLPGTEAAGWPAESVQLEGIVRFPWSGGRHPCLDVLIATATALIGVESKRFEPFRPKPPPALSDAYWRPVWGSQMTGFQRVRDALRSGDLKFIHLDAAQLVKHAFGLRTSVQSEGTHAGKRAILLYLYAEPQVWPGTPRTIDDQVRLTHANEIGRFSEMVEGDEVEFRACSYRQLLDGWQRQLAVPLQQHALAVLDRFAP